eukprot:3657644-Alexandrium_andersonii.AAC.1
MFDWETPASSSSGPAPWEDSAPSRVAAGGEDGEPLSYDNVSREEAGLELYNFIVDLKIRGLITAKSACILAFWSSRAGAEGPVGALARRPDLASGHFSRHFDATVDLKPSEAEE